MNLLVFPLFASTVFFASLAALFWMREQTTKKNLLKRDELQKRRIYEISILKAIQDRIGYSLDAELVVDTLTDSLKNLFPYSTASSLLIADNKLIFKIHIEEQISVFFIEQVKKSMISSLSSLVDASLSKTVDEIRVGTVVDNTNTKMLASFFHIPLVVNGKVVGLINVSSTKPGLYKDDDMTILYQMTNQASTALSKLQEVIKTEEGKLLAMITSLSDGVFMIDKENNLTLINQTAKKLLKLSMDNPTIFDVISKLSSKYDFSAKIQQAMKEKKTIQEKEISLEEKIVEIVITPVFGFSYEQDSNQMINDQKLVIGASVLLHDVTIEKTLTKLKEDFTSTVVHELRSPLSAIKTASELILSEKQTLDRDQERKLIDIMYKQSKRMISDINSLLDAARLESGHLSIYQKSENVFDLLHESVELFLPEASQKHISLKYYVEPNVPKGYFDMIRIEQVVNNLLSNSIKFTPGGGSVTISARKYFNEHLPKTLINPGIVISVHDNGIGIEQEKQASLFSKFARIENVGYLHAIEGTGLGLYIAKGIVEAHGGHIFLESVIHHGTTVSFTLPIAKDVPVQETILPQNHMQRVLN